jgi:hypothetical protein
MSPGNEPPGHIVLRLHAVGRGPILTLAMSPSTAIFRF